MWIKCTNEATVRLYDADLLDAPVEFNDSGTAQVPQSVGESLIDHYDAIRPHDAGDDTADN